MNHLYRGIIIAVVLVATTISLHSQVKGKVIDASTNEPVPGATLQISCTHASCGTVTNDAGEFEVTCNNCKSITVSCVGYAPLTLHDKNDFSQIRLLRTLSTLDEIVLSANRGEAVK